MTMAVNIVALNALKRTKKIMINANPTRLIFLTLARRTVTSLIETVTLIVWIRFIMDWTNVHACLAGIQIIVSAEFGGHLFQLMRMKRLFDNSCQQ